MPASTITIQQLPARLERLVIALGTHGERAMHDAARLAQREAVKAIGRVAGGSLSPAKFNPIDTGELRRSYRVDKVEGGAVLENTARHAAVQEFGSRPYTPPLAPLLAWAKQKTRGRAGRRSRNTAAPRVTRPRTDRPTAGTPAAPPRRGQQAALTPARLREARKLAGRAWIGIRRKGVIPKRYHADASAEFPRLTAVAVVGQLRKLQRSGGLP